MINPNANIIKNTTPYNWCSITDVFTKTDQQELAATFPHDNYRTVIANKGRIQQFDIRPLIIDYDGVKPENFSPAWHRFLSYLRSPEYRQWLTAVTGIDTRELPVEASVFKYTRDCIMDAHTDLPLKVIGQVFYFNTEWAPEDGGSFCVLHSKNENDVHAKVLPLIGNSSIIERADNSWHSVDKTLTNKSRRCVVVAFYKKGCTEGRWWIEGQPYELHDNNS